MYRNNQFRCNSFTHLKGFKKLIQMKVRLSAQGQDLGWWRIYLRNLREIWKINLLPADKYIDKNICYT